MRFSVAVLLAALVLAAFLSRSSSETKEGYWSKAKDYVAYAGSKFPGNVIGTGFGGTVVAAAACTAQSRCAGFMIKRGKKTKGAERPYWLVDASVLTGANRQKNGAWTTYMTKKDRDALIPASPGGNRLLPVRRQSEQPPPGALNALAAAISITSKSNMAGHDTTKLYGLYLGSDGLWYALLKSGDIAAKLKVFVEMNRRATILYRAIRKEWGAGDPRVVKLAQMYEDPGVSHYCETDMKVIRYSCAYMSWYGGTPWIFQDFPLCDESWNGDCVKNGSGIPVSGWCVKTPPLDNRFDSFVHEMGHAICSFEDGTCNDHGTGWFTTTTDLRRIAHRLKLRSYNVRYDCADECGNMH